MRYPIFRIDFNGGLYTQPGILEATIEGYLGNWEDIYGKNPNYTTIEPVSLKYFAGLMNRQGGVRWF